MLITGIRGQWIGHLADKACFEAGGLCECFGIMMLHFDTAYMVCKGVIHKVSCMHEYVGEFISD